MSKKEKAKDFLAELVEAVTETYGKGTLARLGDAGAYQEVTSVISTGLPRLDAAIGVGGLPSRKLVEIIGPESVGKTTLTKHVAAQAQGQGYLPIILDVEESGALAYDQALGLDSKKAVAGQPTTCEEVLGIIGTSLELAAKRKQRILCLWDSLAATPMSGELDADFDDMMKSAPAERARFLGKSLPKIVHLVAQSESCVVIVNQLRDKIGAAPFEKPTYSPGGRALRHWAHVRLEMSSRGKVMEKGTPVGVRSVEKGTPVGVRSVVKVIKNKVAPPYGEAMIEIRFTPAFSIIDVDLKVKVDPSPSPSRVARTPV